MPGIRGTARRSVDLEGPTVETTFFPGSGDFPVVLSPLGGELDLASWAAAHGDMLKKQLLAHGALLFRGFATATADAFERASATLSGGGLYGDYGDLPRHPGSEKLFFSTPYPDDLPIHFHNESSHLSSWPLNIFFYCSVPAQQRGETPIVASRALCRALPTELVEAFATKGLTYHRTFQEGIDVPWRSFFRTDERAVVEAKCAHDGVEWEWGPGDVLRTHQRAAGLRTHPATGERVWFNQVLLHHSAALPEQPRQALLEVCGDESKFPRSVSYGDGSPVPDGVISLLLETCAHNAVSFPWQQGDVIMLDNMLVAHGRAPFVGPRKILVAMAGIVSA